MFLLRVVTLFIFNIIFLINANAQSVQHSWVDTSNNRITAKVDSPRITRTVNLEPKLSTETTINYLYRAFYIANNGTRVIVPRATYNITASQTETFAKGLFFVHGLSDGSVDFSNSTILVNGWVNAINLRNTNRYEIKNLSIAYNTPLASLGTVYNRNGVTGYKLDSDYKTRLNNFGSRFMSLRKVIGANENARQSNSQLWSETATSLPIYQGEFRDNNDVTYQRNTGIFQMRNGSALATRTQAFGSHGTPVVLFHFSHGTNAITVKKSSNMSFKRVRIFGAPGMAIFANRVSSGMLIESCMIYPPKLLPGNELALLGSSADGFHIGQGSSNVILRYNYIIRTGDDSIATNSATAYRVTNKAFQFKNGIRSEVAILEDIASLDVLDSADDAQFFFTDGNFNLINPIRISGEVSNTRASVELPSSIVNRVKVNDIAYRVYEGSRVAIVNNTIRDSNARGIQSLSSNTYIALNRIYNTAISAVNITADTSHFFEGFRITNVKVYKNTINNAGKAYLARVPWTIRFAGIHVGAEVGAQYRTSNKPYPPLNNSVSNIWIGSNLVMNTPTPLGLFSANHVQVWANDFREIPSYHDRHRTGEYYDFDVNGDVYCEASRNVTSNIPNLCR